MHEQSLDVNRTNTPRAKRVGRLLLRHWSTVFVILMLIFFSVTGRGFLSFQNFQDILVAATSVLLLGIGVTFVIITAGIDLSVGFTMGLSAVIMASIIRVGMSLGIPVVFGILAGIALACVAGTAAGIVNGLLVALLRVPPFIATLGMYGIAFGTALVISGGFPIGNLPTVVGSLGNRYILYFLPGEWTQLFSMPADVPANQLRDVVRAVPLVTVFVIVVTGFMIVVLSKTQFGKHVYAVGNSQEVARRAGIKAKKVLIQVYSISGLFAALAGIAYVFRFASGHARAGEAHMLNAIAAVVIGGASLYGGTGKIQGTIIGALIIAILQVGLVTMGVQPFFQYIAIGSVIIIGVLLDQISKGKIRD